MKTEELSGFEQRLLAELKGVVAAGPAGADSPMPQLTVPQSAARRRLGWKPRLALAAAGVAAGVAAAVVTPLIVGGGSTNPAHAVAIQDDGTVRVEIIQVRNAQDADDLERALEEVGIPAEVDYLPWGEHCQRPEYAQARDVSVRLSVEQDADSNPDSRLVAIVDPADFRNDRTLVITANYDSKAQRPESAGVGQPTGATSIGVARGPVAPCEAS